MIKLHKWQIDLLNKLGDKTLKVYVPRKSGNQLIVDRINNGGNYNGK